MECINNRDDRARNMQPRENISVFLTNKQLSLIPSNKYIFHFHPQPLFCEQPLRIAVWVRHCTVAPKATNPLSKRSRDGGCHRHREESFCNSFLQNGKRCCVCKINKLRRNRFRTKKISSDLHLLLYPPRPKPPRLKVRREIRYHGNKGKQTIVKMTGAEGSQMK